MLIDSEHNLLAQGDGNLFPLPPTADEPISLQYCLTAPDGWSRCPSGYAVYVKPLPPGQRLRLVLHGLKIIGLSTAKGKSDTLSIRTDAQAVEKYINAMLRGYDLIELQLSEIISGSVHEIRSINTDIKNASEEILYELEGTNIDITLCVNRAHNVKSLAEILSARTDFLEFISNPAVKRLTKKPTRAFNKFNKAKRSLEKRATEKNIYIQTSGASIGYVNMLPVFEVIPYLMFQNAIKYAPHNSQIIMASFETDSSVEFTISNIGPRLDDDEKVKIFLTGHRGRNAVAAGIAGTGIGLFFLKELVEVEHEGTIEIWQDDNIRKIGSVEYCTTNVRVMFPRCDL